MGHTEIVEKAGGRILSGVCFYIMNARRLRERFQYRTLVTNSAKLANIISGYGYNPVFPTRGDLRGCRSDGQGQLA